MSPAARPSDTTVALAICVLTLLVRLAASSCIPSPLESDYLGYWESANNLASGKGLVGRDGLPTAFMSTGYPIFLSAIFWLTHPGVVVVKVTNSILQALSAGLLYVAAVRLLESRLAALLGTLLFVVYVESIVYSAYVAKENLMIFLMATQLALVCLARPSGWRHWVGGVSFGLATGALALVGNAALSLLPGLLFVLWRRIGSLRKVASYSMLAALACALVIWPMMDRNHHVFGHYSINNNGGFNLYIGNNPNATPFFESITETPVGPGWQELHAKLGEQGIDRLLGRMATEYIASHPGQTVLLALRKAAAFWMPPIHEGNTKPSAAEKMIRLVWVIQFLSIVGLFLFGLAVDRRHRMALGSLFMLALCYTAVHMVFYVVYRYRLPIMPFLCLGAGGALHWLLLKLSPVWRRLALAMDADLGETFPSPGQTSGEPATEELPG